MSPYIGYEPIERWPKTTSGTAPGTSAVQSATYGKRIQVVYGTAPVTAVPLLVIDDGTGTINLDGAGNVTKPVALAVFGLALGPIDSVDGIIYEKRLFGPSTIGTVQRIDTYLGAIDSPGYPPSYTDGDVATAAIWSVVAGMGDPWEVPFGHVATLRCEKFACPGGTTSIGEVKAIIANRTSAVRNTARENYLGNNWQIYDANPADVVVDMIENAVYGLGLPAGTVVVDVGADGTAGSSYRNYCTAYGLWIALGIDEDAQVAAVITQILTATNSVGFWDSGHFKVVPLGDEALTANGATFTPVLEALEIDDDLIVRDSENPVLVRRTPHVEAFNVVPVEWSRDTATRDVELVTNESLDSADSILRGVRRAEPLSLPCIRTEAHALLVSKIAAQRSLFNRSTFEFVVQPQAAAKIEVADLLSLVHVPMQLNGQLVRVTEVDEDARGRATIRAVEWNTAATITITALTKSADGA